MAHSIISASILSANFARLGQDVEDVVAAGADSIHFDVMDHHFVPNLTFGAVVCEALRKAGIKTPIDVHLMVDTPEVYIKDFAKAGANMITFHPETAKDVKKTIQQIHDAGMEAGLAFNPEKPVDLTEEILRQLNFILIMTVNPGFSGQAFQEHCIQKITDTRQLINRGQYKIKLGVDGGIKVSNINRVAKAGADFFVLGSGIFNTEDYRETIQQLHKNINA